MIQRIVMLENTVIKEQRAKTAMRYRLPRETRMLERQELKHNRLLRQNGI